MLWFLIGLAACFAFYKLLQKLKKPKSMIEKEETLEGLVQQNEELDLEEEIAKKKAKLDKRRESLNS